jgi:hypothetical protein
MRRLDASSSNNALRDDSAWRPRAAVLQRAAALDVSERFARLISHALKRGAPLRLGALRCPTPKAMGFEDDLRRAEEHVSQARRMVQRQKGLIIR